MALAWADLSIDPEGVAPVHGGCDRCPWLSPFGIHCSLVEFQSTSETGVGTGETGALAGSLKTALQSFTPKSDTWRVWCSQGGGMTRRGEKEGQCWLTSSSRLPEQSVQRHWHCQRLWVSCSMVHLSSWTMVGSQAEETANVKEINRHLKLHSGSTFYTFTYCVQISPALSVPPGPFQKQIHFLFIILIS